MKNGTILGCHLIAIWWKFPTDGLKMFQISKKSLPVFKAKTDPVHLELVVLFFGKGKTYKNNFKSEKDAVSFTAIISMEYLWRY